MSFAAAVSAAFRRELAYLGRSGWDLVLLFVLPLVTVLVVGAVFFAGVIHRIPVAVVDADGSGLSRAIERDLAADPKIRLDAQPAGLAEAWSLVRAGRAYAVVYVPPGLEARSRAREPAAVVVYFNGAFQTVAAQAADAARAAVQAALAANVNPLRQGETAPAVRLRPPTVQVTLVGNPEQSFELFLEPLVTPLVLNMLLSCAAVFAVGRELADGNLAALGEACGGRFLAALVGKLAPYVLVYWVWCVAWTAYLAGWRGWGARGDLALLLFAQLVFFVATAAIGAFLAAALRKVDLALSISALYAGSGLSFANATLPINGASLFTRLWSAVLPSTSYLRLQEEVLILGSPWASAWPSLAVLALFAAVPALLAAGRLKRLAAAGAALEGLSAPAPPAGFVASFRQTLAVVATAPPILSTVLVSVVLYGFYYPEAYKVQTAVKLPVAVADLDHSPLSRSLLRKLDATREVHVAAQAAEVASAQRMVRDDRVDAAVVIPAGLEASVLKGSPGGVAVYLKAAYLVRSRFIGQAFASAVQASVREVMQPVLAAAGPEATSPEVIERPLYNTTGGYGDYTVPGVASVILQATLLFGVAMFMGLGRERGEWRMSPRAFFGVWAAFTLLGTLTILFFFGFVLWFQDYPRAGNIPGLLACAPLFAASVSALGLLVGSAFERHERSMQILAGTSIPIFFLAGLAWPSFSMPPLIAALARLVPSTAAVPLFVKLNSMGASLGECAPEIGVLAVLVALYGAAAYLRLTPGEAARRARAGAMEEPLRRSRIGG